MKLLYYYHYYIIIIINTLINLDIILYYDCVSRVYSPFSKLDGDQFHQNTPTCDYWEFRDGRNMKNQMITRSECLRGNDQKSREPHRFKGHFVIKFTYFFFLLKIAFSTIYVNGNDIEISLSI